jgi:Zn-dependent M28 family amino/carboxypeptidase
LPNGRSTRNVVGLSSARPKVVIVAHLDGVRGSPAANDNGSGVAVLLELAASLRGEPGVLVAATAAEERVVTGSRVHLGSLRLLRGISPQARRRVRLAVSLDMVGVGTRLNVRGIEREPNRSARLLLSQGGSTYLRDDGDSDHAELTRHGMPAAWLQWRTDACWHERCDVARRVDARKLEAAFRVMLDAAFLALKS